MKGSYRLNAKKNRPLFFSFFLLLVVLFWYEGRKLSFRDELNNIRQGDKMPSVLSLFDKEFLLHNTSVYVYNGTTSGTRAYWITISNKHFLTKCWIFPYEALHLYFDENLSLIKADWVPES